MHTWMSAREQQGESGTTGRQVVTFDIGNEEFGLDILRVHEINRASELTRVPHAPAELEGIINLRGRIVPVLDLARRFNLPVTRERTAAARIIVVETSDRIIGILADRVREVLRLESAAVEPPPSLLGALDADYVSGVARHDGRLVTLLDLDRVFAPPEERASAETPEPMAA